MRTLLFTVLVALSVPGCSKSETKPAKHEKLSASIAAVTVDALAAQLASGACQAVDANGTPTRKKMGVIPGAVLLSDSDLFSTSELPADKQKPLVFYCANAHCTSSEEAAARALTAGYTNVKVLPDGIAGWVSAGKQTQKI